MSTASYSRHSTRFDKRPTLGQRSLRRLTNARAAWLIGDRDEPGFRSWFSRFVRRRER